MRFSRGIALLIAVGAACKGTPDVGLTVTIPKEARERTRWIEVAAYREASCGAIQPMLGNGVPEGATFRQAFQAFTDQPPPKFGQIPNAKYAFAGTARDENCEVLATGCLDIDVGDSDAVDLVLASVPPSGKCVPGTVCQAGECLPALDNNNPSVGANCTLELVGAGPLAHSIAGAGTLVSAPAIAPTSKGFIIAYREIDPAGSGARVTLLPIDDAGGALEGFRPALPNPCATSDETDGIGLIVNGEAALLSMAKAPCGGKPELQVVNFLPTADPRPAVNKFLVSESPGTGRVTLGAARSTASRGAGSLVVFTEGGAGRIAALDAEKGVVPPSGSFGGAKGITDTWLAANDRVLALLAVGPSDGTTPKPPVDAGDSGVVEPTSDGGIESLLRLLVLPAATKVDALNAENNQPRAPTTFPGVWGSIAAQDGRVIVMSDGDGPGRSVSYRAFDLNKEGTSDVGGFSVPGDETVTTGDIAIVAGRAYFATLKEKQVNLNVFGNATTTLTPLRSVQLAKESRISGMNRIRDGRVAIAATDRRVAVVWTVAKKLDANDSTGGYAVFACTN